MAAVIDTTDLDELEARIDDDGFLHAYCRACVPPETAASWTAGLMIYEGLAEPVSDAELPRIRALLKVKLNLPPRDAAEATLMRGCRRLLNLLSAVRLP